MQIYCIHEPTSLLTSPCIKGNINCKNMHRAVFPLPCTPTSLFPGCICFSLATSRSSRANQTLFDCLEYGQQALSVRQKLKPFCVNPHLLSLSLCLHQLCITSAQKSKQKPRVLLIMLNTVLIFFISRDMCCATLKYIYFFFLANYLAVVMLSYFIVDHSFLVKER